jgi:hypothetical protein
LQTSGLKAWHAFLFAEDDMNRDWYKTLTGMMWLMLATTAFNYWRVWDRLPESVAVHFDANWHPNGYSTREGALMLGLGIMTFMVVVFTITASVIRASKSVASWPMLVIAYVALGFAWWGNYYIIQFNLSMPPTTCFTT